MRLVQLRHIEAMLKDTLVAYFHTRTPSTPVSYTHLPPVPDRSGKCRSISVYGDDRDGLDGGS